MNPDITIDTNKEYCYKSSNYLVSIYANEIMENVVASHKDISYSTRESNLNKILDRFANELNKINNGK